MSGVKITVLGAGAFGSALGQVLSENGHEVKFYDPKLEVSLAEALQGAEFVLLAVPSQAVEGVLAELPREVPLVIATKGLLSDDWFRDFRDYMVISGPGFAADIMDHRTTLLTATDERVIELFNRDYLSFDYTADRRGVLLCGALKNVYAILAGLEDLAPGSAEQAKFLTEVGGEMQALLSVNAADPATVELACGQGDLKLTCALPSRNFEFGQILRRDAAARPTKTVEGVSALKRIREGAIEVPEAAVKLRELLERSQTWA